MDMGQQAIGTLITRGAHGFFQAFPGKSREFQAGSRVKEGKTFVAATGFRSLSWQKAGLVAIPLRERNTATRGVDESESFLPQALTYGLAPSAGA